MSRSEARQLQESVGDALTERREFFRTVGQHREDGAYVVARRGADSAGNEKVFERFDACRRLFRRLPEEFTADDVGSTGITGSRRHMLVRHFAEHPAFDCTISRRNPLTAEKTGDRQVDEERADETTEPDLTDAPEVPAG
ncbi:hypothetical protein BRC81_13045 [Halobacteriales archaeon QS_1_68_20]|nr:MAG: hypothetical protein BRC81_13045 [Halobacteriales archaeon QS_1_68_20]